MKNEIHYIDKVAGSSVFLDVPGTKPCMGHHEGSASPKFIRWYVPNYPVHWILKWWLNLETNKKWNKYLCRQYNRMERARNIGNGVLYWAIALSLLKHSKSFRMVLIRKNLRNWYYGRSVRSLHKINYEYNKITKLGKIDVKSKRFYVLKENGKQRPIGAPDVGWKLVTSGMNFFLLNWVEPLWLDRQHGYRPGRGIWSAWQKLLERIRSEDQIFEFDLTKFFNRVPHLRIFQKLNMIRLPNSLVYWYTWINKFMPTMGLDENGQPIKVDKEDPQLNPLLKRRYLENFPVGKRWRKYAGPYPKEYGVSQGLPTSPLLAILVLEWSRIYQIPGIQYADDGIYFPKDDKIKNPAKYIEEEQKTNGFLEGKWLKEKVRRLFYPYTDEKAILHQKNQICSFNLKKSGWVKRNGQWLKSLKFLGITYNPNEDRIEYKDKNQNLQWLSREDALSDVSKLKKFCGQVNYGQAIITEWEWKINKDSLLMAYTPMNLFIIMKWIHNILLYLLGKYTVPKTLGNWLEKLVSEKVFSTVATELFLKKYPKLTYQRNLQKIKFRNRKVVEKEFRAKELVRNVGPYIELEAKYH